MSDEIIFRIAVESDLDAIVQMLADDPLGAQREHYAVPLPPSYQNAFNAIATDPNNELVVAVGEGGVIGVLQVTFIPGLSHQGAWRALIEGVRVSARARSLGIGRSMFEWAINRARDRGCRMVQLTSDKSRPDALRFYESLGFVASHEGMKLKLQKNTDPEFESPRNET